MKKIKTKHYSNFNDQFEIVKTKSKPKKFVLKNKETGNCLYGFDEIEVIANGCAVGYDKATDFYYIIKSDGSTLKEKISGYSYDRNNKLIYVTLSDGKTFYSLKDEKLLDKRFSILGKIYGEWALGKLADKEMWCYVNKDGKTIDYLFTSAYEFNPNFYVTTAQKNTLLKSWVLVYQDGKISQETFIQKPKMKNTQDGWVYEGVFADGHTIETATNGEITEQCWFNALMKDSSNFLYIPSSRFQDREFIGRALIVATAQAYRDCSKPEEKIKKFEEKVAHEYKKIEGNATRAIERKQKAEKKALETEDNKKRERKEFEQDQKNKKETIAEILGRAK